MCVVYVYKRGREIKKERVFNGGNCGVRPIMKKKVLRRSSCTCLGCARGCVVQLPLETSFLLFVMRVFFIARPKVCRVLVHTGFMKFSEFTCVRVCKERERSMFLYRVTTTTTMMMVIVVRYL